MILRRMAVVAVAFVGLSFAAPNSASATSGCWNLSTYGVFVTEAGAADKAAMLLSMKRSAWMSKNMLGKRAYVGRPSMTCSRTLFVYHCRATARFCK